VIDIRISFRVVLFLFLFGPFFTKAQQGLELEARDRDEIRSKAIGLIKDYEQLLNVLATKGTTASDVQDIVGQATKEDGRMFFDAKVNIEDDLYALNADSVASKDVSVEKYLNDWDLFYTKGYDESVSFSDLRLSEMATKEYSYLKVYFVSQFKNRHKDFDRNYPLRKRIALIRFEKKGESWVAWINGIGFYTGKKPDGTIYTQESFEEDYKPFVKEKKARLVSASSESSSDTLLAAVQLQLQKRSDSLYAEAVKAQIQKSEEQVRKDKLYQGAVARGDSLIASKQFPAALEAFTEARAAKPLEIYPRTKVNELTKLLAEGTSDPKEISDKQIAEGDRLFKNRDYEGARQSYGSALKIFPDQASIKEKIARADQIIRNKAEIRSRYTSGNFKQALKEYGRVINENKTNPDYYFERGRCYQAMGDSKKALADLNKAIELDGNFQEALLTRTQVLQKTGDNIRAISDLATLISIDPKNEEYHFRRGNLLAIVNDLDPAIADFSETIKLNPGNVKAWCAKSDALRRKNLLDQALESAEKAIEINPNFSSGQFQKGLALLEKKEDEKSAAAFSKALRLGISPEQEKVLEGYFRVFMENARQAEVQKQPELAITHIRRALTVKPKSHEGYYALGLQYEKLSNEAEALKALDQALFLKDDFSPAYLKKGQIFLRQKQFSIALDPFHRARKYDRKNVDACLGLGESFMEMKQYDSAMVWFGAALDLKPGSSMALQKRGICHFKMENYRRSLMDFEEAIQQNKKNAEAYFYKGKINKALRQFEKAIDDFNEALDLGYSKYECALEIGVAQADMGNHSKAIKFFTNAIKEDPDRGLAYASRGLSYLADEDYKNAMADLDEAIKIDTAMGRASNRIELGFLKLRFQDLEGAEKQFNKALDYDPYNARANYGLGASQFLLGKQELSMRTFEQAFIPRKLDYDKFRKDPWMKEINKNKDFKKLVKAYFK
jgi:tetratricopeptide (TPR) repeat protein